MNFDIVIHNWLSLFHILYCQHSLTYKKQNTSCIYLRQTKVCLETLPATYLGGTNGHHGRIARVSNPPILSLPFLFQCTLHFIQCNTGRRGGKTVNKSHHPLACERPSAVCACSHNGQSALTFCVSPVRVSGPWKAMQNRSVSVAVWYTMIPLCDFLLLNVLIYCTQN